MTALLILVQNRKGVGATARVGNLTRDDFTG